ncbi:MAG: universal stress protein [Myxococcales bacterium]|nr:universal stress protein [Myxococcales bacterium]
MNEIARILIPVDFSDCAHAALVYGARLARAVDAEVEILHVYEPPYYVGDLLVQLPDNPAQTVHEYVREEAAKMLDEMLAKVEVLDGLPHTRRLLAGVPHKAIVEQSRGADLVVMGTHGRSGLAHLLMGSVAEKVIRQAPCPVLVIRDQYGV